LNKNIDENETNRILREILKWEKLKGREILRKKIQEENLFRNKENIAVYYHSDGDKSSRVIEKITSVGYKMILALWKKWITAGIAIPTEKYGGGRCERLFDLNELGFESSKDIK